MTTEKRVALITGSYKGLGFEIAKKLAKLDNIQVIITGRDKAKGLEAREKLAMQGQEVDYLPLDVTDDKSVEDFVTALRKQYGRVDILVNNAGVNPAKEPEESSLLTAKLDTVISTFTVNTVGSLRVSQALIPLMKERNYGRIVNVSTEMASLNFISNDFYPLAPSYRLSKIGLNGVASLLAKELKGTNILVNNYSPGWMKTDIGGADAPLTAEEGAETAVYLATLPDGGPQGGFFAEMRKFGGPFPLPW
ncbi:SDR family NAD(P)-dependent oxidoreductase [Nostoc sp. FACHB-892]|uniref:SDR family NAD(P)-dependent oxidoreductase n=1 Tax=Nostoc flagelliforme FACHB-838 TaxID=2692904 RepID=A0ABR8DUC9_9NOSO|nr:MULTISPECIES: SDR family NAD(P)-dependent oxidoreductase [Nostoc]MBD2533062.1 SDR family NAD(P)-dependent oxidoreductase [Nostoc flagelliforme FACHB-838]MBD2728168.1 SDR family NAD(P)-dependent oxidoreductase [Nostoc sp. FACHB-892]